jgi:hypothetical protein
MVRLLRSETLHLKNRCRGVNVEVGVGNLAAIFSRVALTCSGVRPFRISVWPEVGKARPPLVSANSGLNCAEVNAFSCRIGPTTGGQLICVSIAPVSAAAP